MYVYVYRSPSRRLTCPRGSLSPGLGSDEDSHSPPGEKTRERYVIGIEAEPVGGVLLLVS